MRDVVPPVVCPGCLDQVGSPFRHDQEVFHYRASDPLLRVLECDALGHLLLFRWLVELFDSPPHESFLVGGYPGVEFLDRAGQVVGEADVVLLFDDGTLALAEYKRSAVGLTSEEVEKLESLAALLGAGWTVVATHDAPENCGRLWSDCQQGPPARPRFALTGAQLFTVAFGVIGRSPFAPRDLSSAPGAVGAPRPVEFAKTLAQYRRPDVALHRAWEREGRQER